MNITFEEAEALVMMLEPQMLMMRNIKSGKLSVNDCIAIGEFAGVNKKGVELVDEADEEEVKEFLLAKFKPFADLRNRIKYFYGI